MGFVEQVGLLHFATFTGGEPITTIVQLANVLRVSGLSERTPELIGGKILFEDNFDSGLKGWTYMWNQGASTELIDDPTGNNRGKVLKFTVTDHNLPYDTGAYKRRGGPDIYPWGTWQQSVPFAGNVAMSQDFWLSSNFELPIGSDGWFTFSNFVMSPTGKETDNVVFVINKHRSGGLYVNTGKENIPIDGSISLGEWNNITWVLKNGRVYPYINGKLGYKDGIPAQGGVIGGSARLYTTTGKNPDIDKATDQNDLPIGAYELLDNFKIVQLK